MNGTYMYAIGTIICFSNFAGTETGYLFPVGMSRTKLFTSESVRSMRNEFAILTKVLTQALQEKAGIEKGYRKIREFLPKTTLRSWIVRIFYFVLACMIYNAWIVLKERSKEKITTIVIKLNYIWSLFMLYQNVNIRIYSRIKLNM